MGKLVLQPIREIYRMLEAGDVGSMTKLAEVGIVPGDGLTGNAWKQSAMEKWLPLADLLLGAIAQSVPAPTEPPENSIFYAVRSLNSTDGSISFAFGREVPQQLVAPDIERVALPDNTAEWLVNGGTAVAASTVSVAAGVLRGIAMDVLLDGGPF